MKIALTYTNDPQKHRNYESWLKAQADIEVIKFSVEDANLNEIDNCDALVLSGGVDIHPGMYNNNTLDYPNAPANGFQPERDEFEINLFKSAQKNRIPVLGICRGMQLINTIYNGTLLQDLGNNLNIIHKGNPDKYHAVIIEKGTLLHQITEVINGEINSGHHQAIAEVGKDLIINSKAPDGTIEGIEWKEKKGKPFMLAIQWHPERMFQLPDSPLSKTIRDQFISAVKNSMSAQHEDH